MDFLSSSGTPFRVSHEAPARYRAYRLAAAEPVYAADRYGHYFIQAIAGEGFRIQLNIFSILVAGACLYPLVAASCVALHFMLQGDIRCLLKGFGDVWLTEGLYHLFYVPGGTRHEARFELPQLYLSFHIELSPRCLQRLSVKYTEVREVLEKMLHHSDRGMQQHPARITRETLRLIEELQHCPYQDEPEKSWYLENRIRELLLIYVQDTPATDGASSITARRMQKVRYYLDYHLDKHLTLRGVAGHFHLSVTTFERWFRQYFDQSFYQYLLEQRMAYAQKLLLETDMTLLEIAIGTGYSDASSFSHAFRRYTGHAPGFYRKHH